MEEGQKEKEKKREKKGKDESPLSEKKGEEFLSRDVVSSFSSSAITRTTYLRTYVRVRKARTFERRLSQRTDKAKTRCEGPALASIFLMLAPRIILRYTSL